jgi:hypothetical protein
MDVRSLSPQETIDVSFVMPCLNEAEALGACVASPNYSVRPDGADHQWRKVPPR